MSLKVGIFGGTFDPIHIGHLITTQYVLEKRKLDKIIFVPCHISPHKTDKNSSNPIHRLNMLRLAIEDIPYFDLTDYEIRKGNISYTYDTIVELRKTYANIELIIGYDNLVVFDKWHNPDKIVELAKLVVMKRVIDKETGTKNKYFENAIILDTPTIEISSSELRERIKNNLPVSFMVPPKVEEYIRKINLYRES
ncbi:nicotinate (nicotinamide) nucleotide adenylyltransferase [Melioribacter roseus P3M-2]|uniref:Probable nicotinate-nucleotide adenylyltransferase n=1 Tax=Melioribacter roseus (strain DSM 23840 / JCM 17771 / VKM B-2668 / P3M-2) TaxID=1191523 RepID=I7A717_MELRP|nr:nicotinate-nucleotide adenylyltransferase [Melioribacter roseus]AFN75676.1 nicotinate (nicotinamide) nucleotide adenylyltransferase [Melioribacter roseus P3M-2]